MAKRKDLLSRLADAGEEALNRLGDAPGMDRVTAFANSTRDRLDELTKRVRGIEALESRVAKLEKQVAALSGAKAPARKRTTAPRKRSSTAKTGG
jgi:BMFP domain-containing protein YqiC